MTQLLPIPNHGLYHNNKPKYLLHTTPTNIIIHTIYPTLLSNSGLTPKLYLLLQVLLKWKQNEVLTTHHKYIISKYNRITKVPTINQPDIPINQNLYDTPSYNINNGKKQHTRLCQERTDYKHTNTPPRNLKRIQNTNHSQGEIIINKKRKEGAKYTQVLDIHTAKPNRNR